MKIEDIHGGLERFINEILSKEARAQGHDLSGAMIASLSAVNQKSSNTDTLSGTAVYYTKFVNDGYDKASVNNAQAPFLIEYFLKLGFPIFSSSGATTASQMAFATIGKWKRDGVPTAASRRFSKTGSRTNFVENALTANDNKIDEYMINTFDFAIDEIFSKTKNETI